MNIEKKLSVDLISGFVNSSLAALINILTAPIYLKYLGIEAYGLIGFLTTLIAFISILDMGIAATVVRGVSRYTATENLDKRNNLIKTFSIIYWCLGMGIGISIVGFSTIIGSNWLSSETLSVSTLTSVVAIMGAIIALRWPIGFYKGILIGKNQITTSNFLNISYTVVSNFGSLLIIIFLSTKIEFFFLWQAFATLLYIIVLVVVSRNGNEKYAGKFDINEVKQSWKFTVGQALIAITAIVFTQLDKLVLSKTLTLEDFGYYVIAVTAASSLSLLIAPVYTIISRRFIGYVANNDFSKLVLEYRFGSRLFASVIFPATMFLFVASDQILLIWLRSPEAVEQTSSLFKIILIGSSLYTVMYFPASLLMAYGITKLTLQINAVLMIFYMPMLFFLSANYGGTGAGLSWVVFHIVNFFVSSFLTHKKYLNSVKLKWISQDIFPPLILSVLVGASIVNGLDIKDFSSAFLYVCIIFITVMIMTIVMCVVNTNIYMKSILK